MQLTFIGAAGGMVTGSCHQLDVAGKRILLDCGMIQGDKHADELNAKPFPFDASAIDALVLSHAHIDHIGRVPLLVKRGFKGPIFAQAATCDLLPILLRDSAHLAEYHAEMAARHGHDEIEPLYDEHDVDAAQALLHPVAYDAPVAILPGITVTFHDAGHILGSSLVEVAGDGRTLLFTGDIGMQNTPILRDPTTPPPRADLILMESTYGDRNHKDRAATVTELGEIFAKAAKDGGNVIIPAFAVGRCQELLYWFARHYEDWNLGRWKIFLDSPMAAKVMTVYDRHEEIFDQDAVKVWAGRIKPFELPNLHVTADANDSKTINDIHAGAIIIAGSGMATGGRVRHHLANNLGLSRTHVIFVGYQAEGTLGRLLLNGLKHVRLFGRELAVHAQIHTVGGLSAHADQQALLDWYATSPNHPPVALVHGENPARETLDGELAKRFGTHVTLAEPGMTLDV